MAAGSAGLSCRASGVVSTTIGQTPALRRSARPGVPPTSTLDWPSSICQAGVGLAAILIVRVARAACPPVQTQGRLTGRQAARATPEIIEGVRELDSVGNALCGVPRGSAVKRNGTEAVPYSDSPCFEFPDTLGYLPDPAWQALPKSP